MEEILVQEEDTIMIFRKSNGAYIIADSDIRDRDEDGELIEDGEYQLIYEGIAGDCDDISPITLSLPVNIPYMEEY